jgi:hypothetical protein
MSVNSYLTSRASAAVLSETEKSSIKTSISTLKTRLDDYFGSNVRKHFQFGSSTRGTILPRSMDANSDIDYMVVFAQGGNKPQTYIDRLKRFAENKYSTSEVAQSNPTVVLSLNHIRFELVPALAQYGDSYQIPAPASSYMEWMTTTPGDIDSKLTSVNNANSSQIKPMIRLIKYWNAKNEYVFDSFSLEKWIVERLYYGCSTLRDYLFFVVEQLSVDCNAAQWRKDKVSRAKSTVANVKNYERQGYTISAETEVKKLIPES